MPVNSSQIGPPNTLARPERIAELDRLGDEIAELSAHLDAATARLLELIRKFDAEGGWNHGFSSCAAWLSFRVGLDMGAARERVRVARALETLPLLANALARGELSYAKVRALTRVATPPTQERLLAVAKAGTAEHVEKIVRGWRTMDARAEARENQRQHARRELMLYEDGSGMVVVRGRLEPEVGALFRRALEAAGEVLYQRARRDGAPGVTVTGESMDRPTMGQRHADALVLVAEAALHGGLDPGTPGERYQVVVHVDAAVLAEPERLEQTERLEPTEHPPQAEQPEQVRQSQQRETTDLPGQSALEDGAHVPAGTSRRLACDASRVVMRHDDSGRVIEVGARTRTIPPALRRALQQRDRGCQFPGCRVRVGQGHHLRHWAHGGPTTLTNLALLCRAHHRAVHEEGYRVARQPDGPLRFWRPDGRELPLVPAVAVVPPDPVEALRATHVARELHIHARTGCAGWHGEHLDVGYAIDVLHPLANPLASSNPS